MSPRLSLSSLLLFLLVPGSAPADEGGRLTCAMVSKAIALTLKHHVSRRQLDEGLAQLTYRGFVDEVGAGLRRRLPSKIDFTTVAAQLSRGDCSAFEKTARLAPRRSNNVPAAILRAFAAALDPHTEFFTPEEYEEFSAEIFDDERVGIGVRLERHPLGARIAEVFEGQPAQRSGRVRVGDVLLAINGRRVKNLDRESLRALIDRGPGTFVRLTLATAEGTRKSVRLRSSMIPRGQTDIHAHERQIGGKRVVTIRLEDFYTGSAGDVKTSIEGFQKKGLIDAMVLDLRGNHGGGFHEAVRLTGLFIASGPVALELSAQGDVTIHSDPDGGNLVYGGPLVIAVNHETASAAELVPSALRDYQRAILVGGSATFGKATVQNFSSDIPEWDIPGTMKFTQSFFFSPSGLSHQGTGLSSDLLVSGPEDEGDVFFESDLDGFLRPPSPPKPVATEAFQKALGNNGEPWIVFAIQELRAGRDAAPQSLSATGQLDEVEAIASTYAQLLDRTASRPTP